MEWKVGEIVKYHKPKSTGGFETASIHKAEILKVHDKMVTLKYRPTKSAKDIIMRTTKACVQRWPA